MALALSKYMSVRDRESYWFSDAVREAVREKYRRDIVNGRDYPKLCPESCVS